MEFFSILFKDAKKESETLSNANNDPGFFVDLNLNQVIDEIIKGKEEYHLEQFFYNNLHDIDSINYRLDIMRDLECKDLFNCMVDFSYQLKRMREYLSFSGDLHNHYQKEKWFLDAVYLYCNAVNDLRFRMSLAKIKSEGLLRFYKWLNEYENSEHFVALFSKTKELQTEFNRISYSIQVGKDEVIVSKDESNSDFCAEINKTLQKFSGVQLNYEIRFFTDLEMCALETKILEIIRKMNPSVFEMLDSFFKNNTDFLSNNIIKFDVEIQFYISYLDYINKLKQKGMHFAYPSISNNKALDIVDAYDLAFAQKSLVSHTEVVCNDFYLNNEERIYIITGPNQGGKTTFARAFGQIMFLSMLGCPVPCRKASIFIFDNIYTHFNKEEKLITDYGRLKEELNRLSKSVKDPLDGWTDCIKM
ncbi:MAG: DNA mismatch repair protein MutS [Clostridiaceae bacterium]|nr:DNA mismatch repair protein MutS [Clostridiaceae bacterium]